MYSSAVQEAPAKVISAGQLQSNGCWHLVQSVFRWTVVMVVVVVVVVVVVAFSQTV
jgi:hypothetical protein